MKSFLKGFLYATRGILIAFKDQRNLKVQLAIAVLVLILGFYFDITSVEWGIILLSIALVIAMEMINTAIENLVDMVTTEWKPMAGKVKDIAAGAVLIAALLTAVIGVIIFSKYFLLFL
jgi:diacylglycerol kinase